MSEKGLPACLCMLCVQRTLEEKEQRLENLAARINQKKSQEALEACKKPCLIACCLFLSKPYSMPLVYVVSLFDLLL